MLAHSFLMPVLIWAGLHAVQILAGLVCLRRLRGRWAWAAIIASAVAGVVPISTLVLILLNEYGGVRVMSSSVMGIYVGDLVEPALRWFAMPTAILALAIDPVFWRRPMSFISRLAGAAGLLFILVIIP